MFYSLRNRLFVIILLLITIPLLVMVIASFNSFSKLVSGNIEISSQQTMNQYGSFFNSYAYRVEELGNQILSNSVTQQWISVYNEPDVPSSQRARQTKLLRDYISYILTNTSMIYSITLYTDEGFWTADKEYKNTEWYRQYSENQVKWTYSHIERNQFLELNNYGEKPVNSYIYPLTELSALKNIGILKINVKTEEFLNPINELKLGRTGRFYVVDSGGSPMLGQTVEFPELLRTQVPAFLASHHNTGTSEASYNGETYKIMMQKLEVNDWVLIGQVPESELFERIAAIKNQTLLGGSALLLIALLLTYGVSVSFTRPLLRLKQSIKSLENGDFKKARNLLPRKVAGKSEIGYFIHAYKQMITRLQEHIETEFEMNMRRRNAEYRALLLQINPHFLFNTLEVITALALQNKNKDVVQVTESLGKMIRFSMRLDSDLIDLRQELEYVRFFANILTVRFGKRIEFDIRGELHDKSIEVVKFLLQPLVENAVKYSIEHAPVARIGVSARLGDKSCVITVSDNGCGMSPEMIGQLHAELGNDRVLDILGSEGKRIGLRNVLGRCKLYYGDLFKLDIQSEPGQGTAITLIVPFMKGE